jgi:hypothetical protein
MHALALYFTTREHKIRDFSIAKINIKITEISTLSCITLNFCMFETIIKSNFKIFKVKNHF